VTSRCKKGNCCSKPGTSSSRAWAAFAALLRSGSSVASSRAICDDVTAFDHDADEIFKGEQYRWWQAKLIEANNELEEERDDAPRKSQITKLKRRIKRLENLMAEWQEDHDYWPEEEGADNRVEARAAKIRADTAKRRAASARISALAAAARTDAS
jgi:hypothetical protein